MDHSEFFSAARGRLDRWRMLYRINETPVRVVEQGTEMLQNVRFV
jgi:hypothetical protein